MNVGDWTFKYFQKYLAFQLKPIDYVLVQYSPLIFIYPILRNKLHYVKNMLLYTSLGVLTIFTAMLAGMFIGVYTWSSDSSSPLLPEYILKQPFENYWTIFILIGLIIPVILLILKKERKRTFIETID